jgi:V8-like Glu-specific endopeptidase
LLSDSPQPGIIGRDNRSTVNNSRYPFTAIVRIAYEVNGVIFTQCTGAFIANKVLLTSASCVYNKAKKSFIDLSLISIYDTHKRRVSAVVNTAVTTVNYILDLTREDIALLVLDSDVDFQDVYGFLGIGQSCSSSDTTAALLGYPGERGPEPQCSVGACVLIPLRSVGQFGYVVLLIWARAITHGSQHIDQHALQ